MWKVHKNHLTSFLFWGFVYFSAFSLSTLITMFVLIRGETVTVPDLRGKSEQEAQEILSRLDVYLKKKGQTFSLDIPEGLIAEQSPAGGSTLKKNHFVMVTQSAGGQKVRIPDLRGVNINTAEMEVLEYDLSLQSTARISNDLPRESIIDQEPQAGKETLKNTGMRVLVSQGPKGATYIMPDLIGKNREGVTEVLEGWGFAMETFREIPYEGIASGTIVRQLPEAGYPLRRGQKIVLEVVK